MSLAPSSVLPCPLLGFRVASATLAALWGCLGRPALLLPAWVFYLGWWLGLRPAASLKLRVVGGSWFSPLCSPGRRSASRSTFSALPPVIRLFWACTLLLRVRLRPRPDNSLSALWLPVRLLWSSMRLRVCEGSFHPSLLLGGGLVRSGSGFCCRSLAMA